MKSKSSLSRRSFLPAGLVAAQAAVSAQPRGKRAAPAYPLLDTADVLVIGGGTAGFGAAMGAARAGARTLLIENHSFFGGVASWSLGMQLNQMRPFGRPRSAVHETLIEKLNAYGSDAVRLGQHEVWSNVEYLKVAMLDALDAVGVRYYLHARAADAVVEDNRITGVVLATKRGLMLVRGSVVIDSTGDADVAFYAGAATMTDPDRLMPMTLALALANIDPATRPEELVAALKSARAKYPRIPAGFLEIEPVANGHTWWVNHSGTADMGRIDATDPLERTRAEAASRRQAIDMIRALRESTNPALRQIELAAAGPQVSVRETRRVKGVYVLTEEDAMKGRAFDDAIAWRSGFLDLGGQRGGKYVKMRVHDVPYRSILPEKLDGLLVAGRCISATHEGVAAGKSMGNCMATGHAAGIAAALAAKKRIAPRDLKVREIQDKLRADGVPFEIPDREQSSLA